MAYNDNYNDDNNQKIKPTVLVNAAEQGGNFQVHFQQSISLKKF